MMNNTATRNEIILNYIGDHPYYGKHTNICHMCGSTCQVSSKIIFEGNQGGDWEQTHFEFPICTDCLLQNIGEAMEQMDDVMLRHQIEKEKLLEKLYTQSTL